MLENVPLSNGIHSIHEFKYIIDNVDMLFVHLDIPHAFTSGGMASVIDYINTFRDKITHIHWHDNHGIKDEHLPIGEGFIDHQKAVKTLKDTAIRRRSFNWRLGFISHPFYTLFNKRRANGNCGTLFI